MADSNSNNDSPISRRRLMQGAGAGSAVLIAGCSGGQTGSTETETTMADGSTSTTADGEETTTTTEGASAKRGGKLVVAQAGPPPDFDPVKGLGGPSALVGERFFSTLYTYDEGTTLISDQLTTGMPEAEKEGARYIVEIVDDAQFHNGDPVTPEDVMYSFQAPIDEGSWVASSFNMITNMEAVDETTIQFDLEYKYGAFPHALGSMQIVPKSVREADKEAFGIDTVVGSGPFEFVDWTENEFARLKRWDEYWGDLDPYLEEVEFVPIPEQTTRVTNFKQGNSQVMQDIPGKLYSTVKNLKDSRIAETPSLAYTYFTFNLKEGQTTKLDVRNAVSYVFDMDRVVEQFVEPTGVRQYQPLPIPIAKAWDMPIEEFKSMAHGKDIDQAKSLFEQAGVPSNWECKILVPPDDVRENMMITVANGIKEAGYKASVQRLDWGTFLNKFTTGQKEDYNIYSLGWSVTPDPDYQMYNMYHEQGAGSNHGHYWSDDEVMQKLEKARRSTDREERRQLYIEVQKEVIRQKVQIPAWNPKGVWGVKNSVKDFQIHSIPTMNPRLVSGYNNVWIDE